VIHLDANVLIDARDAASPFHVWAKTLIADHVSGEGAAVDTVALSEALGHVTDRAAAVRQIQDWGVELVPLIPAAAQPAASAFALYLARMKEQDIIREKRTPLPDFLIGAHSLVLGRPLATRDVERFRTYFPEVALVYP
jgi:predicted nucleic acid-binding protein